MTTGPSAQRPAQLVVDHAAALRFGGDVDDRLSAQPIGQLLQVQAARRDRRAVRFDVAAPATFQPTLDQLASATDRVVLTRRRLLDALRVVALRLGRQFRDNVHLGDRHTAAVVPGTREFGQATALLIRDGGQLAILAKFRTLRPRRRGTSE